MTATMKEAIVHQDTTVTIQDNPIPTPAAGQVLVKVVYAGINPKDWKVPTWIDLAHNSGDDLAGYVQAVGPDVFEFREGDRVAGFHPSAKPHGAFAEYAVVPAYALFHLPEKTSFEEAATIPATTMTAAVALFYAIHMPTPWNPVPPATEGSETKKNPLIINGASSAVGAFAIKLAAASNIHPIIAIGSAQSSGFVEPVLDGSKGDKLLDYTAYSTPDSLVEAIKAAVVEAGVPSGRAYRALDAISSGTSAAISRAIAGPASPVLGEKPVMAVTIPGEGYDPSVEVIKINSGVAHDAGQLFSAVMYRAVGRMLLEGTLSGHPFEVVSAGLDGLEEALKRVKDGKIRGKKLIIKIEGTKGVRAQ